MSLDQEAFAQQFTLLAEHRRRLARLLYQQKLLGGPSHANPGNIRGVANARASIESIKTELREIGFYIEDEPNDMALEQSSQLELTQITSDLVAGDKLAGDKIVGDKIAGDKIAGDKLDFDINATDQAEVNIDKRQAEIFIDGNTVVGQINTGTTYYGTTTPLTLKQHNIRNIILNKVEAFWVKGVLQQSLYNIAPLSLKLDITQEDVNPPGSHTVHHSSQKEKVTLLNVKSINVFDDFGQELLILGAPGSGKTTLLLELARDLIARARQNEAHPIPVVFNLANWATKRQPINQWILEQFDQLYQIPRQVAQEWLDQNALILLLNGLDEIVSAFRTDCIDAINLFRKTNQGILPIAVSSRTTDYRVLKSRLHIQGAITIQPLTRQDVEEYLERVGDTLKKVRDILDNDTILWELIDNPLMLSITVYAYKNSSHVVTNVATSLKDRRRQLFNDYIDEMFVRPGKPKMPFRFSKDLTVESLAWLAAQMTRFQQHMFYIEELQPAYLDAEDRYDYEDRVIFLSKAANSLFFGLFCLLFFGINSLILLDFYVAIIIAMIFGLIGGVFGAVLTRVSSRIDEPIVVVERLRWSWERGLQGLRNGFHNGWHDGRRKWMINLDFPNISAMGCALMFLFPARIIIYILYILVAPVLVLLIEFTGGLYGALVGALNKGLYTGLSGDKIKLKIVPNEGIHRSARSWLLVSASSGALLGLAGMIIGLIIGVLINGLSGIIAGMILGAAIGIVTGVLIIGFNYGGFTVIQHYALRWTLYRYRGFPFRIPSFLDHCVEYIFLHRIGGSYIFIHRLLMEHFAHLYYEMIDDE